MIICWRESPSQAIDTLLAMVYTSNKGSIAIPEDIEPEALQTEAYGMVKGIFQSVTLSKSQNSCWQQQSCHPSTLIALKISLFP